MRPTKIAVAIIVFPGILTLKMVDDPIPDAGQPQTSDSQPPPRRGGRSGRGHRGRGRGRGGRGKPLQRTEAAAPAEPAPAPPLGPEETETEPPFEFAADTPEPELAEPHGAAEAPVEPEPSSGRPPPPPQRHFHPAPKASIQRSIEQVNDIVGTLKESLEDMEEVLETLETFERQGNADEREIESLRRALRQLQRPRDGGGHHRGHG